MNLLNRLSPTDMIQHKMKHSPKLTESYLSLLPDPGSNWIATIRINSETLSLNPSPLLDPSPFSDHALRLPSHLWSPPPGSASSSAALKHSETLPNMKSDI